MTDEEFTIYTAGFFDGEGSITIARMRANGRSDYHCIHVQIGQRLKHRDILDRICEEYGGHVSIVTQKTRIAEAWAQQAHWQLQHKANIERFLRAVQPYCIVKAKQIGIALEFLDSFNKADRVRDDLGRIRGKVLTADEIERRESLRLLMRDANELGPQRQRPSTLPPLDVQHRRQEEADLIGNRATVRRGAQRSDALLTDEIVRTIRSTYAAGGVTQEQLAVQYGVSLMTVNKVVRRISWKHID